MPIKHVLVRHSGILDKPVHLLGVQILNFSRRYIWKLFPMCIHHLLKVHIGIFIERIVLIKGQVLQVAIR